ncbi:MAG: hypothetical protein KC468_23615 [Myxococcales bacterium]|nr:hypothetical protein [Myxococcales bacterium]
MDKLLRVLGAVWLLCGCDAVAGGAGSADAPTKAAPAPAGDSAAAPGEGDAKIAGSQGGGADKTAVCTSLADHVLGVLRAVDPAAELPPIAELVKDCEGKTLDPALVTCFMGASDSAGLDACNRKGFEGEVDTTIKRRFDALADNDSVTPPPLTVDGDYMSYDESCGTLFREAPPASALFIVCDGKAQIGPMVNAQELMTVMNALAEQQRRHHETMMGIIGNMGGTPTGVRVHKYGPDGAYLGSEER